MSHDTTIHNIIVMTRDDLTTILKGIRPRNIDLYRKAFVHKSMLKEIRERNDVPQEMKETFERLEYIGDAVLNLSVAQLLYELFPDNDEGFLTRLRTKLVRGSNCAKMASDIGLQRYINPDRCTERLLSDIFESFVGALHLDLGFDYADNFIRMLVVGSIDEFKSSEDNYKDLIMRYTQANKFELPEYRLLSVTGKPHNRNFDVSVHINGHEYGRACANTKKDAEQAACRDAICQKRIEHCDQHNLNSRKLHLDDVFHLMNR